MFGLGLKESVMDTIHVEDVSFQMFQILMEYLYSDTVSDIPADIAVDILVAANK
jgi:hypothetical protein